MSPLVALQTKIALEEQIAEQEEELARVRKGVKRKDEDRRTLEESLHEAKKVRTRSTTLVCTFLPWCKNRVLKMVTDAPTNVGKHVMLNIACGRSQQYIKSFLVGPIDIEFYDI